MASSHLPGVNDARRLAERTGVNRMVVLYTTPDGRIGYASYGATRELCAEARGMADELYEYTLRRLSQEATGG